MIAVTLAAVMAATPYADAFWAKDLGRLSAELLGPAAPHRALFVDLLAVATCRDPGPLAGEEDRALREALRLEWSRRPAAAFADIRNDGFFSRRTWLPLPDDPALLRWTAEEERWPDELDVAAPLPGDCPLPEARWSDPPADFLDRLARVSVPLAMRWRYWLATRHYADGNPDEAAKLALGLDPALVGPDLRPWAEGLRALLLTEPANADGIAQLAEPLRAPVAERGCRSAVEEGRHDRALAFASTASSEFLSLCHVAALARSGQVRQAAEALKRLPPDRLTAPRRDWVRALALATGDSSLLEHATDGLDERVESQWLVALAQSALDRGRLQLAHSVVERLRNASAELDAEMLDSELLFRSGRTRELEPMLTALLDEEGIRFADRRQRIERDRRMAALLRRLVLADAQSGGGRRALLRALNERFAFVAGNSVRAELEAVGALLDQDPHADGIRRRALGVVAIPTWPPLPKLELPVVTWGEPGPLFGIPTAAGGLRTWFDGEEVGNAS